MMKTKHQWHKAPLRGVNHAQAPLYRYTVVRNRDKAERFTDRLPRPEIRRSPDFTVWDNRANAEVKK